ncbi:MAG: DUF2911 domain-containing protein [Gemmatimonadota bacterium]|nr:DUF2911 domain-containing protein [Gemmatimonadota bacterium]
MFTPTPLLASIRSVAASSLALAIAAACTTGAGRPIAVAGDVVAAAGTTDSASFVTRLGVDTVAIERVVYAPQRVEAEVLLRVPATTRTRYVLELSPAGELTRLEAVTTSPRVPDRPARREVIARTGDSLRVETTVDGQARVRHVAAHDLRVLPFIDVVHWPFELALTRVRASRLPQTAQPLLSGSRVQNFPIVDVGPDSMTITHPLRGTMRLRVDARGRLLALDAGATTRKLLVERRPWMGTDGIDALASRWAALDAAGRSLGALSGRAQMEATIAGARVAADYGTPSKRGREIWGALVPYGQVWRTGANQATHFTTDRDLVFGAGADTLLVPAGRYTLFSIPERDGGVLIVSRQTDQAGTAYDPARDLGRVRLGTRPLAQPVEVFTIAANPEATGGVLRLQWDRTELVVPFRVRER